MSDSIDSLGLRLLFALPLSPLSPYLSYHLSELSFPMGVIFDIMENEAVLKQMT